MSVYVDPLMHWGGSRRFHWEHSCHMWADSMDELLEFAVRLGVDRAWFHGRRNRGMARLPHFDLNAAVRTQAVSLGAIELTRREAVASWRELGFLHGGGSVPAGESSAAADPLGAFGQFRAVQDPVPGGRA